MNKDEWRAQMLMYEINSLKDELWQRLRGFVGFEMTTARGIVVHYPAPFTLEYHSPAWQDWKEYADHLTNIFENKINQKSLELQRVKEQCDKLRAA